MSNFQYDQELSQITGQNEAILGIYGLKKHQMNICLEASKIKKVRSVHFLTFFRLPEQFLKS
jgi:hypothetical protein